MCVVVYICKEKQAKETRGKQNERIFKKFKVSN